MRKLISLIINWYATQSIRLWSKIICQFIKLRYPNVILGKEITIYGKLILKIDKTATVIIGDHTTFRSNTKYNFVGINKPVSIRVCKGATLTIGSNCGFSGTSIYCSQSINIGNWCNFGGNASIWDTDFHPTDYQLRRKGINGTKSSSISVGNDVFIGAHALILKGISIGNRTIVGAGSVVSRSVPDDQIWAGNPARFVKELTPNKVQLFEV